MYHMAQYTGSVPLTTNDFDLPAVSDPAITISNNHFIFTIPVFVIGAYAIGANVIRAKIQTPKTRQLANPYIRPVEHVAAIPNRPLFCDLSQRPISLNPIDETQILISNGGAAAEQEYCTIWVSDGNMTPPQGQAFTVRATATITQVVNGYAAGPFILDQVLPAGRYSVIGMSAFGAGMLTARLIFPLQVWRPGVLAMTAVGNFAGDYFHQGYLGELGQFESIAQPQLEVFATAAGAAQEIYLELVRIR